MNPEVAKLLARVKSTVDFSYVSFETIDTTNALGDNALHCVCVWGDLGAVKLLVENGIEINQRGDLGHTPLRVAVDFGFQEIADYLIAHGADRSALDAEEIFDSKGHALHVQRLGDEINALERFIDEHCGDPK